MSLSAGTIKNGMDFVFAKDMNTVLKNALKK